MRTSYNFVIVFYLYCLVIFIKAVEINYICISITEPYYVLLSLTDGQLKLCSSDFQNPNDIGHIKIQNHLFNKNTK